MPKKLLLLLVVASILPSGCSVFSREAPPEDVDKASTLFFQRLRGAEYQVIYDDAASGFKQNKTRNEVLDNLTQLTAAGRLLSYVRMGTYFSDENKKRIATTRYRTDFEKNRGELKLYFIDESGEWKLNGFEYKLVG